MSTLRFAITTDKPDDVSGRAWREAQRAGWYAVGVYHDEIVQPRKFEPGAAERYGFAERSPRYLARKKRIAKASWKVKDGGETPLVFGGMTRTAVLRKQFPRAFPTRVTLSIPTPSYVQMRPRKANMPAMGVELTSVTEDEQREMEGVFVRAAEAFLERQAERRTRSIG
jgi:hypothetical protein